MRKAVVHESAIMLLMLSVAAVVFVETRALTAGAGQLSAGFFPRLGASVIAGLAMIRLFALAFGSYRPTNLDLDWSWARVRRPVLSILLLLGYYLAFGAVPFALLTLVFLLLAFWAYDVRPWYRAVASAVVATGLFYVLFKLIFQLPI